MKEKLCNLIRKLERFEREYTEEKVGSLPYSFQYLEGRGDENKMIRSLINDIIKTGGEL